MDPDEQRTDGLRVAGHAGRDELVEGRALQSREDRIRTGARIGRRRLPRRSGCWWLNWRHGRVHSNPSSRIHHHNEGAVGRIRCCAADDAGGWRPLSRWAFGLYSADNSRFRGVTDRVQGPYPVGCNPPEWVTTTGWLDLLSVVDCPATGLSPRIGQPPPFFATHRK